MKYKIEDLLGKYVKTGTPEAEVFLDACTKVGAEYASRETTGYKFVELVRHDTGELILYRLRSESGAESTSTPFTINPEWSIYTNTLPLRELTDEQAGKLVKSSGMVEHMNPNTNEWGAASPTPIWNRYGVYRIKQKSEREQFVDAMMAGCSFDNSHAKTVMSVIEKIYDSGKIGAVGDGVYVLCLSGKYEPESSYQKLIADIRANALEDATYLYTHKWEKEFEDVNIRIISNGSGFIYPEALLQYAADIRHTAECGKQDDVDGFKDGE